MADVIPRKNCLSDESGTASTQQHTSRRTMLANLGIIVGFGTVSRSFGFTTTRGCDEKGFVLNEHAFDGCGPRAEAIASLLHALGINESYDFGKPRDAIRLILAVDALLCNADLAHQGSSLWESYGLESENPIIPTQELACQIAEQGEVHHESTGWNMTRIEQVLETENRLIIEEYLRTNP